MEMFERQSIAKQGTLFLWCLGMLSLALCTAALLLQG